MRSNFPGDWWPVYMYCLACRTGPLCVLGGWGGMERAWDIINDYIGQEKTTPTYFQSHAIFLYLVSIGKTG